MGYVGSYVWKIRQKIGHDLLVTATVDVVAERNGKFCMVYHKDFDAWNFPGGHVEIEDSWQSAAKRELKEESGIEVREEDLVPFATLSGKGWATEYKSGDKTRPFTIAFCCTKFVESRMETDEEELEAVGWFSLEEIRGMKLARHTRDFLEAYLRYRESGEMQQIVWD